MWARRLAIGLALAGVLSPAGGAWAESLHFSCSIGSRIRQIEVRSDDPTRGVPCEVLYRKESESPGVEVLWTARVDRQFCADKALGLVERLEGYGWACGPVDASPEEPENVEARVPPELKPEPAATLPAVSRPRGEPDPVLATAIDHDLEQLKGSAEAVVDAEIGARGDLNGDGRDDAAVVITFDPDGADHAQYLVAYVADGTTFRPAASKFLGGRYREVYGGQIQGIQDGDILVSLHVLKADDPYCCPSGEQAASFALEGDELLRRE